MSRLYAVLLVFIFSVLSTGMAASWFGLRSGFPLGGTVHYGMQDVISGSGDLRISFNARLQDSTNNQLFFGIGGDLLSTLQREGPLEFYTGGGLAIDIGPNQFNETSALLDIHALVGGEFRFSDVDLDQIGIFAEFTLGAGIGIERNSRIPTFGGALGFNYHF